MKIIIVGGGGFLGQNLARALNYNVDNNILILDCNEVPQEILALERIEYRKADMCDNSELIAIFGKFSPDVVIQLARYL